MKTNTQRHGISVVVEGDNCLEQVSAGFGLAELTPSLTQIGYTALAAWLGFATWDAGKQQAAIDNCLRMANNFKRTHVQAFWLGVSGVVGITTGLKNFATARYNAFRNTANTTPAQTCNP